MFPYFDGTAGDPNDWWWASKSPSYPFETTTGPLNPKMVDETIHGPFITIKVGERRRWAFKTVEARDKFAKQYEGT